MASFASYAYGADSSNPQRKTVYAWFPRRFDDLDTRAIDWSVITHLSFRSVVIQRDGKIQETRRRADVRRLVEEAHAHGVRVHVLVWGERPQNARGVDIGAYSSEYLAHHPAEAVQSLLDYVRANNLDGLDMDDETWSERNTITGGANRELVTQFFRQLVKAFKAERTDYQIFWAAPPTIDPRDKYATAWPDYRAIAGLVDGICIMSYTMNPPTIGWTGGAQPLRGGGKVNGHPRDYETCLQDYLAATGGRRDKLLLGIANDLGGTEWTCKSDRPLAPIVGRPRKLSPSEARANAAKYGRRFDPHHQVPWYCYRQGDQWIQGWYEDEESLAAKLKMARRLSIQGICLWVLDGANEPPQTFQLIREHLISSSDGRTESTRR